jgi:hypothetical protein
VTDIAFSLADDDEPDATFRPYREAHAWIAALIRNAETDLGYRAAAWDDLTPDEITTFQQAVRGMARLHLEASGETEQENRLRGSLGPWPVRRRGHLIRRPVEQVGIGP